MTSLLAMPLTAPAETSAKVWLDRMTEAVQALNYEGTFVFMHGDDIDTMRIVHGHDGSGVRERLISLTGQPREFIRDSDVLTCYWPGSELVVVETTRESSGLAAALPADLEQLNDYYRFEVGDTARVVGRQCRNIEIQPLDAFRYGYRFCIGEEHAMLLKSQMLSPEGEIIEQMIFTNLELRESIPAEHFEPTFSGENFTWRTVGTHEELTDVQPDPGWQIGDLPPGFSLAANVKRPIAASTQPVQHMILTDGMASVSVFIAEPEQRRRFFQGMAHRGAINAYATHLAGHQVTVVGEVPEQTVKMIGNSISYNQGIENVRSAR